MALPEKQLPIGITPTEFQSTPDLGLDSPEPKREPSRDVRLFHRTEVKLLPQILTQGLRPEGNIINKRFYGFTTQLLDAFAPDEFKAIGLLRKNTVFAWHIASGNLRPLTAKTITLAFEVERSRVFIGDYSVSENVVHGLDAVFSAAIEEELERSSIPRLNKKTKKQIGARLWQSLLEEDIIQKLALELPNRYAANIEEFVEGLKEKMRRYGEQFARAYWATVIPFDEFERRYRLDQQSWKWVKYDDPEGYNIPEAMVIGSIEGKKIEVVQKTHN